MAKVFVRKEIDGNIICWQFIERMKLTGWPCPMHEKQILISLRSFCDAYRKTSCQRAPARIRNHLLDQADQFVSHEIRSPSILEPRRRPVAAEIEETAI